MMRLKFIVDNDFCIGTRAIILKGIVIVERIVIGAGVVTMYDTYYYSGGSESKENKRLLVLSIL